VQDRAHLSAQNRAWFERFVEQMYVEKDVARAFDAYVTVDYRQHNPGLPDGLRPARDALSVKFSDPDFHLDVKRVIVDGEYGVVHLHAWNTGERGGAVVDIYRLLDGKVVEHWDVLQPVPEFSANPHPMF
jgi:predicted SnoaL-like aldol condensation-catalyzing enzyme